MANAFLEVFPTLQLNHEMKGLFVRSHGNESGF